MNEKVRISSIEPAHPGELASTSRNPFRGTEKMTTTTRPTSAQADLVHGSCP
jgi:hypothetical protein